MYLPHSSKLDHAALLLHNATLYPSLNKGIVSLLGYKDKASWHICIKKEACPSFYVSFSIVVLVL